MASTEWWQRGPIEGVPAVLSARVDAAIAELTTIDVSTLGGFRGVGRAKLPSTVIGCLVQGAHRRAMSGSCP